MRFIVICFDYVFILFLVNERIIVKLNQNESKIFELLRDCVKETKLPVTLRVAGGWVRDKVRSVCMYKLLIYFNMFCYVLF